MSAEKALTDMGKKLLTTEGKKFIWLGGYETRQVPKSAGFRFDWDKKRWWTYKADSAAKLMAYADDAAVEMMGGAAEKEKVSEELRELSRAADLDLQVPIPDGLSLMPFQKAGVGFADNALRAGYKGVLIGDEMGLGKTIQALALANLVNAETVLVVCPASLKLNWLREAETWLRGRVKKGNRMVVHSGRDKIPKAVDLVVVNDDLAWRKPIWKQLMDRKWDILIVDEAHRMKSQNSKRTKGVLGYYDREKKEKVPGVASRADNVLLLTGTPILNRPVELWPLISTIDPDRWTSFFSFARRYCDARQTKWGWDFSGSSNLGELQHTLRGSVMVRRKKADVLTELPAKVRQVLVIPAEGDVLKAVDDEGRAFERYESALIDLTAQVDLEHASGDKERYEAAVSELKEAMQNAFTEMSLVRHEVAVAKVPQVIEHLISVLDEVEKVVVFAHHKRVVTGIVEGLEEEGITVRSITGETPIPERQAIVDAFQQRRDPRVIVGNIQAAGVGLTLTAASHVVFAELDWVPANITQAEDRCHRIGQKDTVFVQHIVLDGSIDARLAQEIVAKQRISDEALDDEPVIPSIKLVEKEKREPRPKKYPKATEEERISALKAVKYMTGMDIDRAARRNDVGWNAMDSRIGHNLAECSAFTDGQVWLAKKILRKYKNTQLPEDLVRVLYKEKEAAQ